MTAGYKVLDTETLAKLHGHENDFALQVLVGLSEHPKRLSSMYFYDDEGSRLFQAIMALDEYYPTDSEREILENHAAGILEHAKGRPFNLVDLGAGDGAKTVILLDHLVKAGADVRFVPIDISEGAMKTLVDTISKKLPDLHIEGLVSEYADGIEWLGQKDPDRQNLLLFLGSNIGNFNKPKARAFLRRLWNALRPGDYALIGFDLKKDIELLLAAYNDSKGVTAAFNLNVLNRINNELGGNFDLGKWRHFGTYDVFSGAMKSYLVSLERQSVTIEALRYTFEFEAWEPIHTEYSYKYLEHDIDDLANDTGFSVIERFYDNKRWFVDALWQVEKEPV